jgi:phosphomannomutase
VKFANAATGVMVTASHNPKSDNGFKVYWGNGCQIIPPHDKGIAAAIEENLVPWEKTQALVDSVWTHPLCSDPTQSFGDAYYKEVVKDLNFTRAQNSEAKLPMVYTAMHGVGDFWCQRVFKEFNLAPYIPVKEQIEPDAEFPTVVFPNPEVACSIELL